MNIEVLKIELINHHRAFTQYVDELTESHFLASPNEKWSAGQQLAHIYMSVHPVAKLVANKDIMREKFGTLNRPSRTSDVLVSEYLTVLAGGVKAGPRFSPEAVSFRKKENLIERTTEDIGSICTHLENYSEDELEHLVIPHPVMGPFTLREMLMFTIYHVQHHLMKVQELLKYTTSND